MTNKIYIVFSSKGWVLHSGQEEIPGTYHNPNKALEAARTYAAAQDAEIIIYPSEESYRAMRQQRRAKVRRTKNKPAVRISK